MVQEFKDFIIKGNAFDLAIGVIIGGAFGAVVGSLVNDILMPILGVVTGGVDFTNLFIALDGNSYPTLAAAKEAGAAAIAYGSFINAIIMLLMIGLVMFMLVRQVNKMKKAAPPAPPAGPSAQEVLLKEIRDLLAKK